MEARKTHDTRAFGVQPCRHTWGGWGHQEQGVMGELRVAEAKRVGAGNEVDNLCIIHKHSSVCSYKLWFFDFYSAGCLLLYGANSPNTVRAMVDQVLLLLAETADDFLEAAASRNIVHVRGHRLRDRQQTKAVLSKYLCTEHIETCRRRWIYSRRATWIAYGWLPPCQNSKIKRKQVDCGTDFNFNTSSWHRSADRCE